MEYFSEKVIEDTKAQDKEVLTRLGEDKLLKYLEMSDYYNAPASTKYHGNVKGGLCRHSQQVSLNLIRLADSFGIPSPVDGVTTQDFAYILGLVHDLCKVNFYETYLRNKKEGSSWVSVQEYRVKENNKSYGHGFTSVLRLQKLLKNTELADELVMPVMYHMGPYDVSDSETYGYAQAQKDYPWLTLLQSADLIAANVFHI